MKAPLRVIMPNQPGSAAAAREGWVSVLTHTHTFSGKSDHGGAVPPPENYRRLTAWARQVGVGAIGMGSPYTPKASRTYGHYEHEGLEKYYHPDFDHQAVRDLDELEHMLAEANAISSGQPFYYLDNETPKGRYGHIWWVGYTPDYPAWHDYDQPFDRWMCQVARPGDSSPEPVPYQRRPYRQIVAVQRAAGALGFWAHPTSWWWQEGRFITNICTEMPAHLIADGYVDGLVVMGYHPYRPQYQELWFDLLDRGYRVPGVAEMDAGLSDEALWRKTGAMLNYVPLGRQPINTAALVKAFAQGHLLVSNGPFVDLRVDGVSPGGVAETGRDHLHTVELTAWPTADAPPLGRLELLGRGGEVLWQTADWAGGTVTLQMPGLDQRGYLLARVFGAGDNPADFRTVKTHAVTNPVYLHPAGTTFPAPANTEVTLRIQHHSPFVGGEVRFESAEGTLQMRTPAHPGTLRETVPAGGRITLERSDGATETRYLINANSVLTRVQQYLYRGGFLKDFPQAESGEVPVSAWRFDDYLSAMQALQLEA